MRHAEILGALDRVLGLLLMLSAFGLFAGVVSEIIPLPWVGGFGFLVSLLLGLYLMSLGRRVANLEDGARQSQITVSILMLFFPPFLTAFGLYSLIAMTTESARNAFRLGKKALSGHPLLAVQAPRIVHLSPPVRARPASLFMRAYGLAAILFSLYAGFQALELQNIASTLRSGGTLQVRETVVIDAGEGIFYFTAGAAVFSLLVLIRMFLGRRQRRGFGLALAAFVFLWSAAAFLSSALEDVRYPVEHRSGAVHRLLPRTHVSQATLQWENSR